MLEGVCGFRKHGSIVDPLYYLFLKPVQIGIPFKRKGQIQRAYSGQVSWSYIYSIVDFREEALGIFGDGSNTLSHGVHKHIESRVNTWTLITT
jgi:hypothetical protein